MTLEKCGSSVQIHSHRVSVKGKLATLTPSILILINSVSYNIYLTNVQEERMDFLVNFFVFLSLYITVLFFLYRSWPIMKRKKERKKHLIFIVRQSDTC
jgi:hypothetical protein